MALNLAQRLEGEIVNADSRQVYKYMNIGTAKPSDAEQKLVAHHLLDIRLPDQGFDVASFLQLSHSAIGQIHERGRLPILVGGSGQYIRGFLEGWQIPRVRPNVALRFDLERQVEISGMKSLYDYLSKIDPIAGGRVDGKNKRRVIRAIERALSKDSNDSGSVLKCPIKMPYLTIGLTLDRGQLYQRVDARVDEMMHTGFREEVEMLIDKGYSTSLSSMSSVGYQELAGHIIDGTDLADVVQRIKFRTHNIVRKQYSWFRLKDPRINWLNSNGTESESATHKVEEFLAHYDKMK